eukprot:Filipodium_phascolosomae@DN2397_c0_g1_i1.p1
MTGSKRPNRVTDIIKNVPNGVLVGNISDGTTPDSLNKHFQSYGQLSMAAVVSFFNGANDIKRHAIVAFGDASATASIPESAVIDSTQVTITRLNDDSGDKEELDEVVRSVTAI